jgi:hypothetical protein
VNLPFWSFISLRSFYITHFGVCGLAHDTWNIIYIPSMGILKLILDIHGYGGGLRIFAEVVCIAQTCEFGPGVVGCLPRFKC